MRSAGLLLLEVARHAAERAARARRADERVDAAVGLVPDLRAGGGVVRVAIRGVVELVAADGALDFRGNARRELLVVVVVGVRDGLDDLHLGAERAQQRRLLGRLVVRHHDHAAIAAGIAEVREADAGVAGRALDQRAAGLEQPPALEVLEDAAGGAVLHRAAGVQELGLAEDLAAGLVAEACARRMSGVLPTVSAKPLRTGMKFFAGGDRGILAARRRRCGRRDAGAASQPPRVRARMSSVRILTVAQPRSCAKRLFESFARAGSERSTRKRSHRPALVRSRWSRRSIPRKARTDFGIVTRPREVTVAVQSGLKRSHSAHIPHHQLLPLCVRQPSSGSTWRQ